MKQLENIASYLTIAAVLFIAVVPFVVVFSSVASVACLLAGIVSGLFAIGITDHVCTVRAEEHEKQVLAEMRARWNQDK